MQVLNSELLKKGCRILAAADPALGLWIETIGPLSFRPRPERFHSLCRAIIGQQLSNAAARTIHRRFLSLFAPARRPTPARLLKLEPRRLQGCGLSEKKALYLRELAAAFDGGHLRHRRLSKMSDEEIIELLIPLPGIGRWTAEMFLIFCLGRPDIFSIGDLALRAGVARVAGREMKDRELLEHAAAWAPWRSIASLYLWKIAHWKDTPAA
ncbi:MAG: DNA-3-methyladenine glycosylase 2 family protein [Planctomycetota bacterium]